MATGNMHKNLVKFAPVVFELCQRTDKRQTNTQIINIFITILRTPPKGEVKSKNVMIVL